MRRAVISIAGAIGGAGAGLGYAATHDPLVLLTVPFGIVLLGAALGAGVGLAMGLAELLHHLVSAPMRAAKGAEAAIAIDGGGEKQLGQPMQRQL